jgi:hypothetical protein
MALSDRVAACISATDIAASYIGAGFCLPLKSWDWSIRTNTARLAVHTLFSARGFDPESADGSVSAGADRAEKWFTLVAKGIVVPGAVVDGTNPPTGLVDQTPEESEFGFASVSDPLRGW